jgi:hypothetical protein
MYRLFIKRVINSKPCDILIGDFHSLDIAAEVLYTVGFFLTAYCLDDSGNRYELFEEEYFDDDISDYCVRFSFINKGL